ncbi:DUF937 domain-containing protein [Zunongwangia endophytica]|uniref:DUF937 domain-containing protein n=1 Tax=Zunongwangia endophytica TaxID=1808945 RepID=A0ABV8H3P8_9FLAO|nr:DUF937 domain-containing protein [Zunongwangia endophytica]MDN3594279.1 DUF937 domain-containing protein [Zunongwangia endophytica]
MASILDVLNTNLGKDIIKKASTETGESSEKVSSVFSMVLPIILGNFKNKIQEGSIDSLYELLKVAPDPYKFLKKISDQEPKEILEYGEDYSEIILGENLSIISETIGVSLDIIPTAVQQITKIAIPVIVAILSIQKKEEHLRDTDIESLIDSALGSTSEYNNSFLKTILDQQDDPNIINETSGMVLGKQNNEEGVLKGYTGGK